MPFPAAHRCLRLTCTLPPSLLLPSLATGRRPDQPHRAGDEEVRRGEAAGAPGRRALREPGRGVPRCVRRVESGAQYFSCLSASLPPCLHAAAPRPRRLPTCPAEVLGSILGALKSIVNVIGMTRMTPPIKDLLPRLTPILKNRCARRRRGAARGCAHGLPLLPPPLLMRRLLATPHTHTRALPHCPPALPSCPRLCLYPFVAQAREGPGELHRPGGAHC